MAPMRQMRAQWRQAPAALVATGHIQQPDPAEPAQQCPKRTDIATEKALLHMLGDDHQAQNKEADQPELVKLLFKMAQNGVTQERIDRFGNPVECIRQMPIGEGKERDGHLVEARIYGL